MLLLLVLLAFGAPLVRVCLAELLRFFDLFITLEDASAVIFIVST